MTSKLLLASLIAATAPLAACVTDDAGDEIEVEITSKGGKSDAIDGKRLRIRSTAEVVGFDAAAELAQPKRMTVDAASADIAVVAGTRFEFSGTNAAAAVGESPWFGAKKLELSVTAAPGAPATTDIGFILFNTSPEAARQLSCTKGAVSLSFFHAVVIDLTARELRADDTTTFTFAECGIPADGTRGVWDFGTFALPLTTAGSLKGAYSYTLKADLR